MNFQLNPPSQHYPQVNQDPLTIGYADWVNTKVTQKDEVKRKIPNAPAL
jgi:hypothetical protein